MFCRQWLYYKAGLAATDYLSPRQGSHKGRNQYKDVLPAVKANGKLVKAASCSW